jgi:hypothetical protein
LDYLENENDMKLLRNLESIIDIYNEGNKQSKEQDQYFQINLQNKIFSEMSEKLGFDKETVSLLIPVGHSNCLFHANKLIE